MVKKI